MFTFSGLSSFVNECLDPSACDVLTPLNPNFEIFLNQLKNLLRSMANFINNNDQNSLQQFLDRNCSYFKFINGFGNDVNSSDNYKKEFSDIIKSRFNRNKYELIKDFKKSLQDAILNIYKRKAKLKDQQGCDVKIKFVKSKDSSSDTLSVIYEDEKKGGKKSLKKKLRGGNQKLDCKNVTHIDKSIFSQINGRQKLVYITLSQTKSFLIKMKKI